MRTGATHATMLTVSPMRDERASAPAPARCCMHAAQCPNEVVGLTVV